MQRRDILDFFRKIIYLKEYGTGESGESIGFIKLSKKQTRWRVEIHLSAERTLQGEKIYLLDKDKNAINKMLYGTITERGQEIVMERSTGETGMLKGELAGILIGGEGYVVCAGLEDETIQVEDFMRGGKTEKSVAEKEPKPSEALAAAEEKPREKERKSPRQEEEVEVLSDNPVSEEEEEEEEIIQVELMEEHDQAHEFQRLFNTRTNMYPFEDDEMDECVQISPADFSEFSKEYWHMGSNTFLLQGYYNYRHLILAKKGEKMYVGIPGQYHRRDKYLADMFGFGRFKGIQKRQERLGDFGYWMREIEIPPAPDDCMVCAPETAGRTSMKTNAL